jgi:hypothetical protein
MQFGKKFLEKRLLYALLLCIDINEELGLFARLQPLECHH